MMFFTQTKAQEKAKGIRKANKILHQSFDKHFTEQYQSMREDAIAAGMLPENVDNFLLKFKQKIQVELLIEFKELTHRMTTELYTKLTPQVGSGRS